MKTGMMLMIAHSTQISSLVNHLKTDLSIE
jgi:hypothetical protein